MKRNTWVALMVFGVLLVAAYVQQQKPAERGIRRLNFATLDVASIDKVVITEPATASVQQDAKADLAKQTKTTILTREKETAGDWRVNGGLAADGEAIKRALDSLKAARSNHVLGRSKESQQELEVDEAKGLRVELFIGGDQKADVVIGKYLRGAQAVRVGEDIFRVAQSTLGGFRKTSWLKLELFDHAPDKVATIELSSADAPKKIALVKEDNVWAPASNDVFPKGFRFRVREAKNLARSLATMRAKDIFEKDPGVDVTGLAPTNTAGTAPDIAAGRRIVWRLEEASPDGKADTNTAKQNQDSGEDKKTLGTEHWLVLGKAKENGDVYARVSGKSEVVLLPAHVVRGLPHDDASFRDKRPMDISSKDVIGMRIQAPEIDGKDRVDLRFRKDSDVWVLAKASPSADKAFTLSSSRVDQRIAAALALDAAQMALDPSARRSVARLKGRIELTLRNGNRHRLGFGNTVSGMDAEAVASTAVYAVGNADDGIYVVRKSQRDRLLLGLESFEESSAGKAPGLSNFDPSQLQGLPPEVRRQLEAQIMAAQQK